MHLTFLRGVFVRICVEHIQNLYIGAHMISREAILQKISFFKDQRRKIFQTFPLTENALEKIHAYEDRIFFLQEFLSLMSVRCIDQTYIEKCLDSLENLSHSPILNEFAGIKARIEYVEVLLSEQ